MQPQFRDDDENFGAIDLEDYQDDNRRGNDQKYLENSAIDLDEYSKSSEGEKSDWWKWTKDVALQSVRGVAQAFTWPLDVLKLGMVAEGLSGIDELEASFEKQGKPFDRDEYIKTVLENSDYIPTVDLLERIITENTGFRFDPTTPSGKFINKASMVAKLAKGGIIKRLASGATASGVTQGLKTVGANELASEFAGDVVGGLPAALSKSARKFTPEAESLMKLADKHGLPFYEFMTRPEGGAITPKISQAREAAIMKELGITSEQAAKAVVEGRLPITQLRNQGFDLAQLESDAYKQVDTLAVSHKTPIKTDSIVKDIEKEISRIKKTSASPSDNEITYMNILKDEKKSLTNPTKNQTQILGPNGQPLAPASTKRIPKEITSEQLVKQHKNYNSNVKGIYRKPEFSGREEAVRDAYAFLNSSIRNTMEKQGGKPLAEAFKNANKISHQRYVLNRSEALIDKAFVNGEYSPKKFKQLLSSKKGDILRRDLGDQAIKEITEIAEFGEKAVNHTSQILKKPKYAKDALTWGSLAPFILGSTAKMKGALFLGKPIAERIKGYLLTRPATRTVYSNIIRNASKGSFNNMKGEFGKLEQLVVDEFGSVDKFVKQMIDDFEVYGSEV